MKMSLNQFVAISALITSFPCYAYYDDGYSNESHALQEYPRWMEGVSSHVSWMQLSLPGTHDSAALYGGWAAATQKMSIPVQLRAGVRWFDLRAKWENDHFPIYHGPIYQRLDLRDVLSQIKSFLDQNPSESVTMRLSQEGRSGKHSWRTFGETFERQYRSHFPDLFWMRHDWQSRDTSLGSIRGKIYLLHDFPPYTATTGGLVPGSHYRACNIQDQYSMHWPTGMYGKWEAIKRQFLRANDRSGGYNCYINYLSAAGTTIWPYFTAGGRLYPSTHADLMATGTRTTNKDHWPDFPRRNCVGAWCMIYYQGMNTLAKEYLNRNTWIKYVGGVPTNFPGPGVIKAVINVNFR